MLDKSRLPRSPRFPSADAFESSEPGMNVRLRARISSPSMRWGPQPSTSKISGKNEHNLFQRHATHGGKLRICLSGGTGVWSFFRSSALLPSPSSCGRLMAPFVARPSPARVRARRGREGRLYAFPVGGRRHWRARARWMVRASTRRWRVVKCGGRRRSLLWDRTGSFGRRPIHYQEPQLHDRPAS